MVYETSYASGTKPFSPDPKRGKWDKPTDYIFACFVLALNLDIFEISYWFFFNIGFVGMLPYFLYMVIYLVPILVVHSFMGQFSSSGFIAAFRLAPLFKGMDYVSVFLTFSTLIYYSMFVAIPLLFIMNSFRPTLPWSCEGLKSWHNRTDEYPTLCHPSIYKQHKNFTLGVEPPSRLYFDYLRQDYFNADKRFDHHVLYSAYSTGAATQLFTVLQSLFDEFETLKERKQKVTFGTIFGLAICSFFFCTEHGSYYFAILGVNIIFAHSLLHLLLLLVVLWIYGQKRFQRDIEFMLGQPFASWKVFILRYTAPIVFVICLILGIIECIRGHSFFKEVFLVLGIVLVVLPFLAIPGYAFYYLKQSPGTFLERLKRSCRPTDWYPVDVKHPQHYGDLVGNIEMTDHLSNGTEKEN